MKIKRTLGHLTLFENVKEFPIRVKCATLIWRALEAALNKTESKISTENKMTKKHVQLSAKHQIPK